MDLNKFKKTEGSRVVLNTDQEGLKLYKQQRSFFQTINTMKNEIEELKRTVQTLQERIGGQ